MTGYCKRAKYESDLLAQHVDPVSSSSLFEPLRGDSLDEFHELEPADGTLDVPLRVGDTFWGATVWLTEAGFHEAIADRRARHFTVLQTNFAHKDEVDMAGDTPWEGDRWNVRFMQKLDRMFTDANVSNASCS